MGKLLLDVEQRAQDVGQGTIVACNRFLRIISKPEQSLLAFDTGDEGPKAAVRREHDVLNTHCRETSFLAGKLSHEQEQVASKSRGYGPRLMRTVQEDVSPGVSQTEAHG